MIKSVIRGFALFAVIGGAALADEPFPPLNSEPMLTVTGLDETRFPGGTVQFDRGRLEAINVTEITTSTPWTEGPQEFTGTRLSALTDFLGVTDGVLVGVALNDYSVEIPVSDAVPDGPIIAFANNDKPMPLRSRGPLWVIYPFDQKADYRSEVIYTRSIWQLNRLEVRP